MSKVNVLIHGERVAEKLLRGHLDRLYPNGVDADIRLVWFSKTVQNWKCLFYVQLEGLNWSYAECTYNGERDEMYIDKYNKVEKTTIKNVSYSDMTFHEREMFDAIVNATKHMSNGMFAAAEASANDRRPQLKGLGIDIPTVMDEHVHMKDKKNGGKL